MGAGKLRQGQGGLGTGPHSGSPSQRRAEEVRGGICCFQSPHSSCPDPRSPTQFCLSDRNPGCFRSNHGSLPGLGGGDIDFCSQTSPAPGADPFLLGSVPFLGSPAPSQAEPFSPWQAAGPGPPTFLALVSMLVGVGADVAGDALVVWEAEAGPVAQDAIAALAAGAGQSRGGVSTAPPPADLPLHLPGHRCCPELPPQGHRAGGFTGDACPTQSQRLCPPLAGGNVTLMSQRGKNSLYERRSKKLPSDYF